MVYLKMENAFLLKLLKSLSKEDLKGIKLYLASPYLNKKAKALQLFKIIITYHPEYSSPRLTHEKLFYRVYSKTKRYTKNAASNFRSLIAHLTKCIQGFLILEALEKQPNQQQLLLLNAYIDREIPIDSTRKFTNETEQLPDIIGEEKLRYQFLIHLKLFEAVIQKSSEPQESYFAALNQYLDLHYCLVKIKLGIEALNQMDRGHQMPPVHLLEDIQSYIYQNAAILPKPLVLYSKLLQLAQKETFTNPQFEALEQLFVDAIPQLKEEEALEILITLYNFCNRKTRAKITPHFYRKKRFSLFQLGLEHKFLLQKNFISNSNFQAIALSGAVVQAFNWVEQFMKQYQHHLPKETQKEDLLCTEAVYYYLKGNYYKDKKYFEKSIQLFNRLKTKNPPYKRQKVWGLLKAQYELFLLTHNEESISKFTRNFSTQLRRATVFSNSQEEALLNTNKFVKLLVRTRLKPDISYAEMKTRFEDLLKLPQRDVEWLNARIEEYFAFKFPNQQSI